MPTYLDGINEILNNAITERWRYASTQTYLQLRTGLDRPKRTAHQPYVPARSGSSIEVNQKNKGKGFQSN